MFPTSKGRIAGFSLPLLTLCATTSIAAEWTLIKSDNLSEWSNPGKWWRTENGVFIAESKGGENLPRISYLQWKGSTGKDFELSAEYRIITTTPQDAGLYFRVEQPLTADDASITGYQAELDTGIMYGKQKWVREGKLFGHIHDAKRRHMFKRSLISTAQPNGKITTEPLPKDFVPSRVFRKTPEWNHCRVVVVGERLQLFLNGVLANEIIDRDPKKRSTGDGIALQYRPNGGYRYEVRHLKFRPATEVTAVEPQPAGRASEEEAGRLALAGKHAEAAAMLEGIFFADPSALDTMGGLKLAALYSAMKDKEKHKEFCEKLFRKYANPKVPGESERPAKAYALFPGANDAALLKTADAASLRGLNAAKGFMRVWFELSRGIVQYRKGEYAAALKSLRRPLRGKHPTQRIPALAFGAMVAFQQNNPAQARKLLADAEKELAKADPSKLGWHDVVATRVALEEAKALIQ